jgi:predicted nucleic acid-binding protein
MMAPVFADTAYYLALLNPRDALHARALEQSCALISPVVTTAWVVHELGDALSSPKSRGAFVTFLESLEADENTSLVEPDPALWRRGLALYRARPDKAWSLTDCVSFTVMSDRGLTDALTSDHHFEQAGFQALLCPR